MIIEITDKLRFNEVRKLIGKELERCGVKEKSALNIWTGRRV